MDPNAALAELLDVAREVTARRGQQDVEEQPQMVALAEGVIGLHDWLENGGFLPAAWVLARTRIVQEANYLPSGFGGSAAEHGGE